MIEDLDFKRMGTKLEQAEDIDIQIQPLAAYILVALIQVALRHPRLRVDNPAGYENGKNIAELLIKRLGAIDPEIARSLETGWDESMDMSKQDFKQFHQSGDLPQRNYSQLRPDIQREVYTNSLALGLVCDLLVQAVGGTREQWLEQVLSVAIEFAEEAPIEQIREELARLDFKRDFEAYSPD